MSYFVFSISFVREKKTEFYYYYYYFTHTYSQVMCLVAEKLRENKRKRDMGSWVFICCCLAFESWELYEMFNWFRCRELKFEYQSLFSYCLWISFWWEVWGLMHLVWFVCEKFFLLALLTDKKLKLFVEEI